MSGYIFIILAIVFVVVIFGVVFLGSSILQKETRDQLREYRRQPSMKALEILESRYANGEIDQEDFDRMRRGIEESAKKEDPEK